ncbi:MAG: GNAT family N-acetyltransferase [Woeseiaceae bacterium]
MHGRLGCRKVPGCANALIKVTVNDAISDIPENEWDALLDDDTPFLRHAFLQAAEHSGSAAPETGWIPRHLTLYKGDELRAAMPLYEKNHSWGEFVFDWAWAQAYERAGLEYYPKLVSAIPFTPATSARLLLRDAGDTDAASALVRAAIQLADDTDCSSLHILFPNELDLRICKNLDLKIRKDCQFHWHNQDYKNFDEFLMTFSAPKRKKVRQDRRRVADAGITFRRIRGGEMDDVTWRLAYQLISITFMRRGSMPYFDLDFFKTISTQLPDNVLVIFAEQNSKAIAAAVFYESNDTLYGRYWGSDGHYDALHFDTCYYQGIEYCIESGKNKFEPGTQGEHKVARGFTPVQTSSAHWLRHPEFFAAIGAYVDEEAQHVERYMQAVDEHSPYRDNTEEESS